MVRKAWSGFPVPGFVLLGIDPGTPAPYGRPNRPGQGLQASLKPVITAQVPVRQQDDHGYFCNGIVSHYGAVTSSIRATDGPAGRESGAGSNNALKYTVSKQQVLFFIALGISSNDNKNQDNKDQGEHDNNRISGNRSRVQVTVWVSSCNKHRNSSSAGHQRRYPVQQIGYIPHRKHFFKDRRFW